MIFIGKLRYAQDFKSKQKYLLRSSLFDVHDIPSKLILQMPKKYKNTQKEEINGNSMNYIFFFADFSSEL